VLGTFTSITDPRSFVSAVATVCNNISSYVKSCINFQTDKYDLVHTFLQHDLCDAFEMSLFKCVYIPYRNKPPNVKRVCSEIPF
jgi:hypothetical protein